MSPDVDEDLIEATIRRVAEAKAARGETDDDADTADSAPEAHDRSSAPPELHLVTPDEDAGEVSLADDPPVRPSEDEDPIEATIRRVAEAKAARELERPGGEATEGEGPAAVPDVVTLAASTAATPTLATQDYDAIEETIRRVAAAKADRERTAVETPEPPGDEVRPAPVAPGPTPSPANADLEALLSVVARLELEVAETREDVRVLASRLQAIESAAHDSMPAFHPPHSTALHQPAADEADFDDAPQISRMPFGTPPRPAIFRDPSPHTATAEQLVPAYDSPVEAAAHVRGEAPAAPERRGLDLLPRGYRVTVEDKRRDVDLVPLHRALLQMPGMKDMSLLSYSNGVAIISLEMTGALDPDELCATVSRAMARPARVEVHNDTTMVVKLSEE